MKDPTHWFEEAVNSDKYKKDLIEEVQTCISEGSFDTNKFLDWVSKELEKTKEEED